MKKLFVDLKGNIVLRDVKEPFIEIEGLIVKTSYGLISSGTELAAIQAVKLTDFSIRGILKNFIRTKEYRKRLFEEFKKRNLKDVFFFYKLLSKKGDNRNFKKNSSDLIPLGYSCSGTVVESNIKHYEKNTKVACSGSSHAELIYAPKNLSAKVPEGVSLEEAAFVTLGAIALHGIHRADIKPGENVGVIGTGLIGLLAVQLAKISGAKVFAFDLVNSKLNLAKKLGADIIINPLHHDAIIRINKETDDHGLDSIIICATSKTSKPLEDAVDLIREKGKIVVLGAFPIKVDRSKLYYKEADLLISRSYGPGRYDPYYEYEGYDYPEKYVQWTEQRNIELFLKLISEKKLNVKELISDIVPFEKANDAYNKLINDSVKNIAILLDFTGNIERKICKQEILKEKKEKNKLQIGLIGCGLFAQEVHLPYLLSNPNCKIKGICTEHQKSAKNCEVKYHPDFVTTDYLKILKDPDINTVFIYTRHNTHEKLTIEALKAGKNVYVEKPMAITMEQCLNVYKTVKETGKLYLIGFNRRYSPFIMLAKDLLKNRENPIIINYRIANSFTPGNHWIFDTDIGGGPIIGEFCHFTDLILYLMNSVPIELIAKGGSMSHKNLDCFDSCVVIIKFKNGSIANLIYTDLSGPKIPKERLEIFSGDSAIIIDDFIKMETSGFDSGNLLLNKQDKGHNNEISSIINVNLNLEKPIVDVNDAIRAMDLCFKTIEAIKTGFSITINDDLYLKPSSQKN